MVVNIKPKGRILNLFQNNELARESNNIYRPIITSTAGNSVHRPESAKSNTSSSFLQSDDVDDDFYDYDDDDIDDDIDGDFEDDYEDDEDINKLWSVSVRLVSAVDLPSNHTSANTVSLGGGMPLCPLFQFSLLTSNTDTGNKLRNNTIQLSKLSLEKGMDMCIPK